MFRRTYSRKSTGVLSKSTIQLSTKRLYEQRAERKPNERKFSTRVQERQEITENTQQVNNIFKAGTVSEKFEFWKTLTSDSYILEAIKGYRLEFTSEPTELYNRTVKQTFSDTDKFTIKMEIQQLLSWRVIEKVTAHPNQVLSTIFLTTNKDGSKRLILNLKKLNSYMEYQHFKMENIYNALELLSENSFLASIDLKKAYYSIPVNIEHRRYLRFTFDEDIYEFTCLPNGISTAPRLFAKLIRVLLTRLRKDGHSSIMYIDDCLLVSESKTDCEKNIKETLKIMQNAGFYINWKKCNLEPSQKIDFLGFTIKTDIMLLTIPNLKVEKLKDNIRRFIKKKFNTNRELSSLLGTIISILPAYGHGKLHYRWLERCKMDNLKNAKGDFEQICALTEKAYIDINYWLHRSDIDCGRKITEKDPEMVIQTDASLQMWGAVLNDLQKGENWSTKDLNYAGRNINALELMAIKYAIQNFLQIVRKKTVLIRSDNTTAVCYVNNMGGHTSDICDNIAREIWKIAIENTINLKCAFIAGCNNNFADFMSRLSDKKNTEWSVSDLTFTLITTNFGEPTIDLFASEKNKKCEQYVSWVPDKNAYAIDAFTIKWQDMGLMYIFPPFSLMGKTLAKIQKDGCKNNVIIVYPDWEAQTWYPTLQRLLKAKITLPQQPFTRNHPMNSHLKLRCGLI